jgi:RNA polymerase sigma-70 factor (ECF subfamily)
MVSPAIENGILVARLRNSNDAAFQAIYQQYHHAVFANITRIIKRQQEAEDILQDVFIALWEGRFKLTAEQSIPGWLFTTSYYKTLSHIRKTLKQSIVPLPDLPLEIAQEEEDGSAEEAYMGKLSVITNAMELLPPRKRTAFQLCRLEGKTYEEVADILEISVDSVRDYVKTASTFIRKQILQKNPGMSALSLFLISIYL